MYDKPIAIVYNTNSGKKIDLRPMIEHRLDAEKIPFEIFSTEKRFDTFNIPRAIVIDDYSLIVAAGGDGSYHEVVNGMLARDDKKKLPIGLIPNGSGNDLCTSLGIRDLDSALDYIVNREVTKIDTCQVLIDHEDESSLPEDAEERFEVCRHMLICASFSFPANVSNKATPFKGCCGKASYTIATLLEAIKCNVRPDRFDITIDGQKHPMSSIFLMLFNNKSTGAGMILNPFPVMNDGMIDVSWLHAEDKQGVLGIADILDKAKKEGGIHTYEDVFTHIRGSSVKIEFTGSERAMPEGGFGEQVTQIDGEDLRFKKFVNYQCHPGNVEYLFDSEAYFKNPTMD